MSETTAVISVEEQLKAQLALQANRAAQMQTKPNFMSFKGGQLLVDGQVVPNATAQVTILATQPMRQFYEGRYDPEKTQVPACYSYDMEAPHPEASSPQAKSCADCEHNKWGSAAVGKGKACKEVAKLALVSANAPIESAPLYQASVPVTSLSAVKDLVNRASAAGKLAAQYTTELRITPDAKSFFKVHLTMQNENGLPLQDLLPRVTHAADCLKAPLPKFDDEEEAEAPKKKSGKY